MPYFYQSVVIVMIIDKLHCKVFYGFFAMPNVSLLHVHYMYMYVLMIKQLASSVVVGIGNTTFADGMSSHGIRFIPLHTASLTFVQTLVYKNTWKHVGILINVSHKYLYQLEMIVTSTRCTSHLQTCTSIVSYKSISSLLFSSHTLPIEYIRHPFDLSLSVPTCKCIYN